MTRFLDGRTDRRSDCTPRPAFAFGDAVKNLPLEMASKLYANIKYIIHRMISYPLTELFPVLFGILGHEAVNQFNQLNGVL